MIKKRWLVVFFLAIAVRLGFAIRFPPTIPQGDEIGYVGIAHNLLEGKGYSLGGESTTYRAPAYPIFLAILYWCFGSSFGVVLVQAILGACLCVIIYGFVKRLTDERSASLAALFVIFDPFLIYYTNKQLSEVMFAFLIVLSFWCFYKSFEPDRSFPWVIYAAIAWALTSLCRPSVFIFIFLAPVSYFLFFGIRKALLRSLVFVAVSFAVLSVWGFRNKKVAGHFVLTATNGGWTFWEGLNPRFDKEEDILAWQSLMAEELRGLQERGTSAIEVDRYYWNKSKSFVKDSPVAFMKLSVRKLIKFWRFYPYYPYSHSQRIVSALYFVPLFLLAVVGMALSVSKKLCLPLLAFVFYFTAIHVLFWTQIRYRVPLHPILAVFAALGARRFWPQKGVVGG